MRHLIPGLALLASISATAQTDMPIDKSTGRVNYEAIFDATGTEAELFKKVQDWFQEFYPNAASVINSTDVLTGKIVGLAKFRLYIDDKKGNPVDVGMLKYSIKVWVKDGKVRYQITDIRVDYTVYYGIEEWMNPAHDDAERNPKKLEKVDAYVRDLIASLTSFMTTVVEEKNEDDW